MCLFSWALWGNVREVSGFKKLRIQQSLSLKQVMSRWLLLHPQPITPGDWPQGPRPLASQPQGEAGSSHNLHLLLYFFYLGGRCQSPYSLSLWDQIQLFYFSIHLVSNQLSPFNPGIHLELSYSSKVTIKVSGVEGESQFNICHKGIQKYIIMQRPEFQQTESIIPPQNQLTLQ